MRDEKKVFPLLGEASASIYPLSRDVMRPLFEKHFSEQRFYGPTFLAFQLDPKPISPDLLDQRNPYNNPNDRLENLAGAVEIGYLVQDGDGYKISDQGSGVIADIHQKFYEHVNKIQAYPAKKMAELAEVLEILVGSVARSELEGGKFCFECSHGGHLPVEKETLAYVDQLLDDLNAFRDDAHIAAWKPTGITGPVLEVLTLVWNGEANTPEKLVERLPYRTFREDDYQTSLDELVEKGWIEKVQDGYQATVEGKGVRDQIEAGTDDNYFGPWKVLSDDQLKQLGELLKEMSGSYQALVEDEE